MGVGSWQCQVPVRFWHGGTECLCLCHLQGWQRRQQGCACSGGWGYNLCSSALTQSSVTSQSLLVSVCWAQWLVRSVVETGGCSLPKEQKTPQSACGFCALQLSSPGPSGPAWALLVWEILPWGNWNSFVSSCCTDFLLQNIFLLIIGVNVSQYQSSCVPFQCQPQNEVCPWRFCFPWLMSRKITHFSVPALMCFFNCLFEKKSVMFSTLLKGLEQIMNCEIDKYIMYLLFHCHIERDFCITQNPLPHRSR